MMTLTIRRMLAALLGVLLLWGCTPTSGPPPAATSGVPTPPAAAASVTPEPAATPGNLPVTLNWWMPSFLGGDSTQPGGDLLEAMLADYAAATEGAVSVRVEGKARSGKGGLLDYLRTAPSVAPGVLPDIIALDIAELEQAAALGVIRPLDGLLDEATLARLYPGGATAGQLEGQRLAVPLVLDLEHVMYDRRELSSSPETWTGLLVEDTPYIFPLGSPPAPARTALTAGVQPVTLSHYLGGGYTLNPETRLLELVEEPLMRLLNFYADAAEQGQLADRPEDLVSLEATLQAYTPGTPALLEVSARQFSAEAQNLQDWTAAAIPGWSSPSPPVVSGWALAILTPDPARQQQAADFIAWLLAPERNGPYARRVGWLPVSQEALDTWDEDAYRALLSRQLQLAVAPPAGAGSVQAAARLQEAVLAVVHGEMSPEEATRRALTPNP